MSPGSQRRAEVPPRLSELYRAHAELVWRTVRYLGVRPADAEDVVHEIFIIVQRRLGDYDPQRSERCWIMGIARNVVMHHHRKLSRMQRKHLEVVPPTDAEPAPDELVARREAARVLQAFLDDLDVDRREAFVLGELEGLTANEIALIVGSNANTVYSRLRSARRELMRRVDRLGIVRRREGG